MTDIERLEDRLAAVERTVVDGTFDVDGMEDPGELAEQVEALESRLQELEERLAEMEGTVQSMGGFVGRIQSVNEGVEQRADAAIAAVDRIEARLDELDRTLAEHDIDTGAAVVSEPGHQARSSDTRSESDRDDVAPGERRGGSGAGAGDGKANDTPERRIEEVVDGTGEGPPIDSATDEGRAGGGTSSAGEASASDGSSGDEQAASETDTSVASDGGGRSFAASQEDVAEHVSPPPSASDGQQRSDGERADGDESANEAAGIFETIRSKFQ